MTGDDAKLREAFRALDDVERDEGVSTNVEARLREQVRSIAAARRRERIHTVLAMAAALLITATGVLIVSMRTYEPGSALVRRPSALADRRAADETTAFLPLPYSGVPMRDGQIVRLEVPRAALAKFGLAPPEAIDADASRGTVLADVLVGEDGLARAVRFVRPAPPERQETQENEEQQEKPR